MLRISSYSRWLHRSLIFTRPPHLERAQPTKHTMSILSHVTESHVVAWLKARLLELQRDDPNVCRLDVDVSAFRDDPPEVRFTAHSVDPSAIGYMQPTIADALAALQADINAMPSRAIECREQAAELLREAQDMDGKSASIRYAPDPADAAAEAQNEGRLMPEGSPNPHDD